MLTSLKEFIRHALGPFYSILTFLIDLLLPFRLTGYLYWPFVVSAILISLIVYLARAPFKPRSIARGFIAFLLPKSVYAHQSAWVDLKYYAVNALLNRFVGLTALVSSFFGTLGVGLIAQRALTALLGRPEHESDPSWMDRLGYTFAIVIVADGALWISHFLEHKIGWLWEFHKVHHSAEVLTPLTNLRFHPVDVIFQNLWSVPATGFVVGLYGYWFPKGVVEISILGMSAAYFLGSIFGLLRHMHIRVGFGPITSLIFSSPAMHQLHHSSEPRHFDKNFGFILSLWDTIAGTNYIPAADEEYTLGIGDEGRAFHGVRALYFYPFLALARRIGLARKPKVEAAHPGDAVSQPVKG